MAVIHYTYQTIKIPTKKGNIAVRGNDHVVLKCEKTTFEVAGKLSRPSPTEPVSTKRNKGDAGSKKNNGELCIMDADHLEPSSAVKPSAKIKTMPLNSTKPDKTMKIGANLNPK